VANQGLTLAIRVEDLALDEEGRVTIQDPQVAKAVAAATETRRPRALDDQVTNNCHGGNCAAGCGTKPQKPKPKVPKPK
jgi:hypothetical protein